MKNGETTVNLVDEPNVEGDETTGEEP